MSSENKIIWIDSNITHESPSTKHWVSSAPQLLKDGWLIEAWSCEIDLNLVELGVVWHQIPNCPIGLPLIKDIWFLAYASIKKRVYSESDQTIFHTNGPLVLTPDIISVQFINSVWSRLERKLGLDSPKSLILHLLRLPIIPLEKWIYQSEKVQRLTPVSESIADALRAMHAADEKITVFPNSYDENRFCNFTRNKHRDSMRSKLGFSESEFVFMFLSQGHYRRKGFWLLAEALSDLLKTTRISLAVKVLVVGGYPQTIAGLKQKLSSDYPQLADHITFTGMVDDTECYYAAADAFLFPSYFEAFCLAEIEAAAMELPLLVTPHHGTEMILTEGVNGLTLPWDKNGIVKVLDSLLSGTSPLGAWNSVTGFDLFQPDTGRALDQLRYAEQLDYLYTDTLNRIQAKQS